MAFTIATSVGSTATGRPNQGHICYAVNAAAWFVAYLTSTQQLSFASSSNSGTSWSAPTGSPFTLQGVHTSEGRNFGFAYANIASTDVLHMVSGYYGATFAQSYASRFTLGTTITKTNAEAALLTNQTTNQSPQIVSGATVALDTNNLPHYNDPFSFGANAGSCRAAAANTDSGTSWSGLGTITSSGWGGGSQFCQSTATIPLPTAKMLNLGDNENGISPTTFTQIQRSLYSAGWGAAGTVLASAVTATDDNNWCACAIGTATVYVLSLSNNTTATVFRSSTNGTTWSTLTAPGTLTLNTSPSGIWLGTDGTNLWAFAADSSKNVQYNKYNVSAGTWGGWTVLEATRTTAPAYITGAYSASLNEFMLAWSEGTAIVGSVLSLGGSSSTASAAGVATAAAVGASAAATIGSAAGGVATSVKGAATAATTGSAAGVASSAAVGAATFAGVASAVGSCTAAGAGASTAATVASAAGSAAVAGIGASKAASEANAAGVGTTTATGAATAATVANATGDAAASGFGAAIGSGVATAAGTCSVVGASSGSTVVSATASAAGGCSVAGVGTGVVSGAGAAGGVSACAGAGAAVASGVAGCTGLAAVSGAGAAFALSAGAAAGMCSVLAHGGSVSPAPTPSAFLSATMSNQQTMTARMDNTDTLTARVS